MKEEDEDEDDEDEEEEEKNLSRLSTKDEGSILKSRGDAQLG